MRRRIRLTGRTQIAVSDAEIKIADLGGGKRVVTLVPTKKLLEKFPAHARVLVVLKENKLVELVEFGTLGVLKAAVDLKNTAFVAPTCQLRIVSTEPTAVGLLLGSTDTWTLAADQKDKSQKGILNFMPGDIAPRAWKLIVQENDYPVVYVDKRIPDVRTWVRNDPTFLAFVLPAIIAQVFEDILAGGPDQDVDWIKDWCKWADRLMPGTKPPFGEQRKDRLEWIENLQESFSQRYHLSDKVVSELTAQGGTQ